MSRNISIILLVTILCLAFLSCGKDDNLPVSPNINEKDTSIIRIVNFFPKQAFPGSKVTIKFIKSIHDNNSLELYLGNIRLYNDYNHEIKQDTNLLTIDLPNNAASGKFHIVAYSNYKRYDTYSKDNFIILDSVKPVIIDFAPRNGLQLSTVKITGYNFDLNKDNNKLFIGDLRMIVESVTSDNSYSYIIATVPQDARTNKISISTTKGLGVSLDDFVVTDEDKIRIFDFEPKRGDAGTIVNIKANLINSDTNKNLVYFGSLKAKINNITKSGNFWNISVTTPAGVRTSKITMKYDVYSDVSDEVFFVSVGAQNPVITSFTPEADFWGRVITIYGNNFGVSTYDTKIYLDKVPCPIQSINNNQIVVTIPLAARSNKFTVETQVGKAVSDKTFELVFFRYAQIQMDGLKYQSKLIQFNDTTYVDNTIKDNNNLGLCSYSNNLTMTFCYDLSHIKPESDESQFTRLRFALDTSNGIINTLNYISSYHFDQHSTTSLNQADTFSIDLKNINIHQKNDSLWIFELKGSSLSDNIESFSHYEYYHKRYRGDEITRKSYFIQYYPTDENAYIIVTLKR